MAEKTAETLDVVLHYDVWLEEDVRIPAAPVIRDEKGQSLKNDIGRELRENVKTTLPKALAAALVKAGKAEIYLDA